MTITLHSYLLPVQGHEPWAYLPCLFAEFWPICHLIRVHCADRRVMLSYVCNVVCLGENVGVRTLFGLDQLPWCWLWDQLSRPPDTNIDESTAPPFCCWLAWPVAGHRKIFGNEYPQPEALPAELHLSSTIL